MLTLRQAPWPPPVLPIKRISQRHRGGGRCTADFQSGLSRLRVVPSEVKERRSSHDVTLQGKAMSDLRVANPELARAIWGATPRASTRRVAARLRRAGMPVSHQTIHRWKRNQWRPIETSEHPLELARQLLDEVTPLRTGDPLSVAAD